MSDELPAGIEDDLDMMFAMYVGQHLMAWARTAKILGHTNMSSVSTYRHNQYEPGTVCWGALEFVRSVVTSSDVDECLELLP
jgi:hypothetical protein